MAGVLGVSRLRPPGYGAQARCVPRPWDSAFFGVSIAQIDTNRSTPQELARAVDDARDAAIDCLYFLADAGDAETVRGAEANGFALVDIRLTLECPIATGGTGLPDDVEATPGDTIRPSEQGAAIRTARPHDLAALMALARANHRNTRFYHDTHFDRARCDELYAVWIERSVTGELADVVWLVESGGAPRGYLTLRAGSGTATIGLVAVDAEYRGRGYGDRLLQAAARWATRQGLRQISVVTQGRSAAAVRFYERAGFTTSLVQLWYHRWLRETQRPSPWSP
jgi:ribosomal protein S18 acetylase RimI-like enzyme